MPPMRCMATAMVSCASRDSAPSDMPPVQKRRMIAAAGSTSPAGAGFTPARSRSRSRSAVGGRSASSSL